MEQQSGDKYLRHIAAFIRANARGLAEAGLPRRKPAPPPHQPPFPWFSYNLTQKPLTLTLDTHHLFYILVRLQSLGFDIGTLDVHIDSPSRPMSYANIYPQQKDADTLSLASIRSSLSAVSSLSLGGRWWSTSDSSTIEADLKFIYSSFTKLPSLAICGPGRKVISELMDEPPNQNAVPLDVFKNLQRLECDNIDPRALLGWDHLAESLRSLKIVRSGLQEISEVIFGAVLDDQNRRKGGLEQRKRNTNLHTMPPNILKAHHEPSLDSHVNPNRLSFSPDCISESKWAFLKHLYLPDNSLTSFPADILPRLTSLTHLDLSSNLLVSVPSGLVELYNLRSLNLADNLIDSVLGIYLNLGQILSLNLSRNRLESICGLERLMALERIDLRYNLIEESSEISRLAPLPNLSTLFVEGNPFTEIEEDFRITCFNYFWKEGKFITLDGTQPSLYEKRSLTFQAPSNPIDITSATPSLSTEPPLSGDGVTTSLSGSHSRPRSPPVGSLVPEKPAPRRKKLKRIVDLDHHQGDPIPELNGSHSRLSSLDDSVEHEPRPTTNEQHVNAQKEPLNPVLLPQSPQRPHHSRHQSDFSHSSPPNILFPSKPLRAGSTTLASRAERRRTRMAISVFEPSSNYDISDEGAVDNNIDSYRQQIESLKQDMGESWLKVFNQSEAT